MPTPIDRPAGLARPPAGRSAGTARGAGRRPGCPRRLKPVRSGQRSSVDRHAGPRAIPPAPPRPPDRPAAPPPRSPCHGARRERRPCTGAAPGRRTGVSAGRPRTPSRPPRCSGRAARRPPRRSACGRASRSAAGRPGCARPRRSPARGRRRRGCTDSSRSPPAERRASATASAGCRSSTTKARSMSDDGKRLTAPPAVTRRGTCVLVEEHAEVDLEPADAPRRRAAARERGSARTWWRRRGRSPRPSR